MFFRQLILTVGVVFVATAGLANAEVAPEYLRTNMLDSLPQLQLEDESYRATCPLTGMSRSLRSDVAHPDSKHLYDWALPAETLAAREKCAMPAPLPDLYENIG